MTANQPADPEKLAGARVLTHKTAAMTTAFWLGYSAMFYGYSINWLPTQVQNITGDETKGTGIAIVSGVSGVVNLIVAVVFGALNDRMVGWPRIGRRKPFIAGGALLMSVMVFVLNINMSLGLATLANTLFIVCTILCSSAWYGIVADVAPNSHFHVISSWQGATAVGGNLVGAIIGIALSGTLNRIVSVVFFLLCTAVTMFVPERPAPPPKDSLADVVKSPRRLLQVSVVEPWQTMRKNKPFFMVFLSRFLFQLGINTLIQIFPYWIQDCVPLPSGSSVSFSTNLTLVPLLIISPIAAGILSLNVFRRRRKAVVYYCAVSFAVVCALTWAPVGYSTAFVLTAIMGLGYGPFSAIEFAMALDTLHEVETLPEDTSPKTVTKAVSTSSAMTVMAGDEGDTGLIADGKVSENYARDLSMWHNALVLPSLFSTPLAGVLRDVFQPIGPKVGVTCFGYKMNNVIVVLYIIAGAVATHFIPGMK